MEEAIRARVTSVYLSGRHGPYAVAFPDTPNREKKSYTFSLKSDVWQETAYPESGSIVLLEDVRVKAAGWRAHKARFLRREDEA